MGAHDRETRPDHLAFCHRHYPRSSIRGTCGFPNLFQLGRGDRDGVRRLLLKQLSEGNRVTRFKPFYDSVQAHYDLSNEFFSLFLDRSMTYSCAFFASPDMTLEEAQRAKIDLTLSKCGLKSGQTLLDVGCGWGSTMRRAAEEHGVRVVGLTLSRNQRDWIAEARDDWNVEAGQVECRLQGWEEFDEPVDRIVSIGAFEHFRKERYSAFFDRCRRLLPEDGRLVLHSIIVPISGGLAGRGLQINHEHIRFAKFIRERIVPGGQLCPAREIVDHATQAGFRVAHTESLQRHYAPTLDCWAERLQSERERAIALTSQETYDTYVRYLTGCARHFRSGHLDVMQFTLCMT